MLYTRDFKYEKAKKLIENLGDSEDEKLIKYYIQKNEERTKELQERNNEYYDFFRKLNSFLPNMSPKFK